MLPYFHFLSFIYLALQTYEEWKSALPDTKFIKDLFPNEEEYDKMRSNLISFSERIKESVPEFKLGK